MLTHYYICAHLGFLHVYYRLTRYRRNADRATFSSSTSVCSLSFDDADCFMSFSSLSFFETDTSSLCSSFISNATSSILCVRIDVVLALYQPDLSTLEHEALTYEDKLSKFCEVIKQVGGQAVILKDKENVNDVIKAAYPDAKRIASTIKEIKTGNTIQPITCSTFHPDDVEESGDLDGTDVAIVDGRIGVCENGAVWLTQDVEQRAVYFISEALVIILDRNNLVNNMHEAYKRIDTGEYGYGVFISGPSKTADIEQALVMGAHGARSVTVILI